MDGNIMYRSSSKGSSYGQQGLYGKKKVKMVESDEEPEYEEAPEELRENVPLQLNVENRFRQSRDIRMWILEVIIIGIIVSVIMYFHYRDDNMEFSDYYKEYIFETITSLMLMRLMDTTFEIFFDRGVGLFEFTERT